MTTTESTAPTTESGEDTAITLYRLQGCPYCERIVRQLDELDLAYHSRFVEALHSRRNAVKRVSGVRTVPVLVDERTGVTMAESANIAAYLEATYENGRLEATDEAELTDESETTDEAGEADWGHEAPAEGGE